MSNSAEEVHRTIREYRAFLETGTRVSRRDIAALKFSGACALQRLKDLREQLADAAWAALRDLSLKSADLFELLFLARRRDFELCIRSDRHVDGGVECVREDVLDDLDSTAHRLAIDNFESAVTVSKARLSATNLSSELVRRANELLDALLCSCGPPSQDELWQYWLDLRSIHQLIACMQDLHLGPWAVKLAQEARRAAKATKEFEESTQRKIGGWEAPDHDFIIAQERGCRMEMAHVLCEIRQKLRRIGEERPRLSDGRGEANDLNIPSLPDDPHRDGLWLPQVPAARSMGYKNHLHFKNSRGLGYRAHDGSCGKDPQGRVWRRDRADSKLFWYYKPSLIDKKTLKRRGKAIKSSAI